MVIVFRGIGKQSIHLGKFVCIYIAKLECFRGFGGDSPCFLPPFKVTNLPRFIDAMGRERLHFQNRTTSEFSKRNFPPSEMDMDGWKDDGIPGEAVEILLYETTINCNVLSYGL